jgi:radical SAM protein with 4Fe4S-binding SPASM domain
MMILPEHFKTAGSRAESKAVFASSVRQVELEVSTYCNRTCWFCPNSRIDRRSTNHYMDEGLYLRILSELAEISYGHIITYNRYNEPLADRIILQRLRQARTALPQACLSTATNGDYLTRPYLDELQDAGLNRLFIMTYLGNDEPFSDASMLTRMTSKALELGLRCEFTEATAGVRYSAALTYHGMDVYLEARNFAVVGTDRGKLVAMPPYVRTSWCPVVFTDLVIDWNGRVVPCCNIRSDAPEHANYVVDDLSTGRSIFESFAASNLVNWRRSLFNFESKQPPCDSCRHALTDEAKGRRLVEKLAKAFIS